MQRVRRAADVALALVVALCLSSLPAAVLPFGGGVASAATVPWPVVDAGRLGGADRRIERVGRVRRDREPGIRAGRSDRARGRIRDVEWIDRHAQGVVEQLAGSRARSADPHRQRRRVVRRAWATRPTPVASRQRVARSRCACSAARSSTRSPGATRRTHSSKAAPPGLRRRHPVSKGDRVALAAMPSTRTTTPRTGSCRVCRDRRTSPQPPCPDRRRRPRRRPIRRTDADADQWTDRDTDARADRRSDGHAHADAVADP